MGPVVKGPPPIVQIVAAFGVGLIALAVARCSATGQLTPVMACRLDALKVLPADPLNATVADAVDVIQRVRACGQVHGDAGPP